MTAETIKLVIRDCGVPANLLRLDSGTVSLALLDEFTETVYRTDLSLSDFCDLALEWRRRRSTQSMSVDAEGAAALPDAAFSETEQVFTRA
jgi:hypothetical protein